MNTMRLSILKKGGLLFLLLALMASSVFAAGVTALSGSDAHNGTPPNGRNGDNYIFDNSGTTRLSAGRFIQLIRSVDTTISAPNTATGAPTGDDVVVNTGTIGNGTGFGAGEVLINGSVTNTQYVYLRAWETWTGSGPATGNYGDSIISAAVSGFAFYYTPNSFSTNRPLSPTTALAILTSTLPNGRVGVAYNQTLAATGGTAPLTWAISSGTLPAGLTLSPAGVITGTPTASSATVSILFQVRDSSTPIPSIVTRPISITIDPATTATLSSIAVTPATPSIAVGATRQFVATGTYSDATTRDISATVTWASATPATATINASGLATGVAAGTSSISATLGSVSGNTTLTVSPATATPSSIAVTPANPSIAVGATQQFVATGTYSDATTRDISATVTWTSTTPATATINSSGLATAVAAGTSVIRATLGTVSGNTTLTVGTTPPTLSITGPGAGGGYPGQTIVINGTGFGASKEVASTVTIGGIAVNATAWSDTKITTALPSGATGENVAVVVTIRGTAKTGTIKVNTTGIVIDDVEGGSVGTWATGLAQSGYYVFENTLDITPNRADISSQLAQAEARKHGGRGAKVRYSYVGTDGTDWGGGWGATLTRTLDASAFDTVSFFIRWDGSINDITLSLQDSDGTAIAAKAENARLIPLGSNYAQIQLPKSAFAVDAGGSRTGDNDRADWNSIVGYNMIYNTRGTTVNYQFIDSIVAGTVDLGTGEVVTPPTSSSEVVVTQLVPSAGPAGTRFQAVGNGFGASQGRSTLVFQNNTTGINYTVDVRGWSDTTIEAIVPQLAPVGTYTVKVVKQSISSGGTLQVMESNPQGFSVTAGVMGNGIATIYPNPFNPLSTDALKNKANISGWSSSGATNIGLYIFDSTAKLVYQKNIVAATDTTWDGKDSNGGYAADGLYLLRIVNEDTKATLAKGKILVIKK